VLAGWASRQHTCCLVVIPDAIGWGELHSGERHEGMFYSLVTLAQKVASSVSVPLALLVLDVTGYVPNSAVQPASAVTGIRIIAGPIPATLLCLGILFALLYPLGRERYNQISQELAARRQPRVE
jgi:GPH family glycoside/pentoside/hexuronide:cation symporter